MPHPPLPSRRPRRPLAVLLAVLAAPAVLAAQSPAAPAAPVAPAATPPSRAELERRVDSLARAFLAERQAPGVAVAVLRGRDTLLLKGYGEANAIAGIPAGPATVYQLGSITKQFTAALVMRLVERGEVALDDPIGRHLPALPAAWRPVTVHQLLNHTSGIPSYTNAGARWAARWRDSLPPDSLVALTARDTMEFAPGAGWNYNNTGYVLLGMLLERRMGKPYATLVRDELARPLGLTTLAYCTGDTTSAAVARGHVNGGAQFVPAPPLHLSHPYAAGALCASAGDVARWNRLLAGGRVVRPASYAAMTTPDSAAAGRGYAYGLAVGTLDPAQGVDGALVPRRPRLITHGGGIPGFVTDNAWLPDDSLSVTVLANASPSDPGRLLRNVARVALGLPVDRPAPVVALAPDERARYAGRYELRLPQDQRVTIRVFEQDGKLMAQGDGQSVFELRAHGDHVFSPSFDPNARLVFTLDGGRASRFALHQGGGTFEAPRVAP